ncbi:MAG TPA: type II CAAX endopeptidase family protein [Rhabdochlamydiaceae bacterium]|nr:type II CAAX endopeptidase family protein [Rhabdochlamydiaceae bacterium]
MVSESIHVILVFGLLGLITNSIAWKKGFYEWYPCTVPRIAFKNVACVFGIYLGTTYLLANYFGILLLRYASSNPSLEFVIYLQFFLVMLMVIALFVYCQLAAKEIFAKIWKYPIPQHRTSPLFDFSLGVMAWFIAFPVVQVIGQIFDLALYFIFNLGTYEQAAVRYLKTTLQSPSLTMLALISIVVIAPVVEEFLFRGALQTYLKQRFQRKTAIVITSICFALFHFSVEQGYGNFSLIPSLFVFACFLGYIYERQGSLYASIGLHMAFNFVSSTRILLSE